MDSSQQESGIALLGVLLASHNAAKKLAEHAELSVEEVFCLFILQELRPQNVKALARDLGVRSSRMSKILFSLEDRGFVVRSISLVDHRMEEVTLTARGTDRVARVAAFARSLAENAPFSMAPVPHGSIARRSQTRNRSLDQEITDRG
jgi:DNA-binding MarR family transcriptional regulator